MARDLVFVDSDSIEPGQKWRDTIDDAISQAQMVVVFWCTHSSQSSEVLREYQAGVQTAKKVLPVLLDSTPMPPEMSEFQWIDFRDLATAQHGASDLAGNDRRRGDAIGPAVVAQGTGVAMTMKPAAQRNTRRSPGRPLALATVTCVLLLALMSSYFLLRAKSGTSPPPPITLPIPLPTIAVSPIPPDVALDGGGCSPAIVLVGLILLLAPPIAIALRRRAAVRRARNDVSLEGQRMAERLQAELLRRVV